MPFAHTARRLRSFCSLACAATCATTLLAAAPAAAQQKPAPLNPSYGFTATSPVPGSYRYAPAPATIEAAPPAQDGVEAPATKKKNVAFDLGVVTELPIMVGAQATLEVPYRFLFQGEFGVLPAGYVNTVDSALVAANAYDATTSALVRGSLSNSLVVRASVGWRPFTDHGFEIMGGYTLASLGGGLSARAAIEAATGSALPPEIPDAQVPIHSTVHSLHATMGWRWVIAEHFLIRVSVGYLQSVASSSRVDLPESVSSNPTVAARLTQVNQVVDSTMNATYTTYVKVPTLGLALGYRF